MIILSFVGMIWGNSELIGLLIWVLIPINIKIAIKRTIGDLKGIIRIKPRQSKMIRGNTNTGRLTPIRIL